MDYTYSGSSCLPNDKQVASLRRVHPGHPGGGRRHLRHGGPMHVGPEDLNGPAGRSS